MPDGGYLGMLSAFHEVHCIVSHSVVRRVFSPAIQIKKARSVFDEEACRVVLTHGLQKRLYQTLHKEHYFPNATAKEIEINLDHDRAYSALLFAGYELSPFPIPSAPRDTGF